MFQIRVNNFAIRDSSVGTANSFIITVRSPIRQFPHIDFFYPFVVVTYKYLILIIFCLSIVSDSLLFRLVISPNRTLFLYYPEMM